MTDNDLSFFFPELAGPGAAPLPPAEVRITELSVEPYDEGQKVRVYLEATPFQKRPWIEAALLDSHDDEVANVSVIEPLNWKIAFVLHVRRAQPQGSYRLVARLYYPEMPENDRREVAFTIE